MAQKSDPAMANTAAQLSEDQFRRIVRAEIFNFMTENLNTVQQTSTPATNLQATKPAAPTTTTPPPLPFPQKHRESAPECPEIPLAEYGPDIIRIGDVVDNRFKVNSRIKTGGYIQSYDGVDTKASRGVLIKVEAVPFPEYMDAVILKALQGKKHFPVLYASGHTNSYSFAVVPQFGRNLSEIRHSCSMKPARLSMSATYRCTLQCMKAVEELHNIGFIHRDPKPSNYYVSKEASDQTTIYLLDYSLCRKYIDKNGSLLPARDKVGFRGTVRYASMAAHENKELCRGDDLWSLFYLFVELMTGQLPWRKTNEKDVVAKMKITYSPEVLAKAFPSEIAEFVQLLRRLKFPDKPDYAAANACFTKILINNKMKMDDTYDWQVADCRKLLHWMPPP